MNRREFLVVVGATACSGSTEATRTDPPRRPESGGLDIGVQDTSLTATQVGPSPLAVHGDVLLQSTGGELRVWDTMTMRRRDAFAVPHLASGFLPDGTIIAFATLEPGTCGIHRLDASGHVVTSTTSLCGALHRSPPFLVRAPKPDEVYVVRDDDLALFRITGVQAELVDDVALLARNASNRAQMVGLDDGRLVALGEGLHVLELGKAPRTLATPGHALQHLARATGDRVWYSYSTLPQPWRVNMLALARIEAATAELHRLDVAPDRIIHVTSRGDAVAALLFAVTHDGGDVTLRWSVVVVDERGRERWRAAVPDAFASLALNNVGFLAMTEHRVVLQGNDHALLAWDASTGAIVTS